MTTAFYTHPDCLNHHTPQGHAEQVARLDAVLSAVADLPLDRHDAPLADISRALLCHPEAHLDLITQSEPSEGITSLDADTYMSPGSLDAALRGIGGACAAVDAVLTDQAGNAFVATRPPGHHAERETPMGFCLFGTVAIAAKYALDHHGLSRVAIVDFDVHHGNGTQDLVQDDPRITFVSSHEMPLYPGTGDPSEVGPHGTITNIALEAGCDGAKFRDIYEAKVFPMLEQTDFDLLLISAGFDAHKDDPLAHVELSTDDFAWVTERLCDLAAARCNGRVVSVLEGGYNLDALGQSARVHVETLLGRAA